MVNENVMGYAGNLEEELREIENLIPEDGSVEVPGTTTARCDAFLTIICC